MSYADGLLSTGERILHRNKQHPFTFIWGARYTILAILIAAVLTWISANMDPAGPSGVVRSVLGWVILVLVLGGLAVLAWTALRYVNQEYVLTNRRVIQVEGVLNRSSTDSSLEKINDALLVQSVFGRIFDFGDLTVLTAAESGIERFRMIRRPIVFKKAMLDAKHEYEVDMERSGWAPSPPIRANPPAVAGSAPGSASGASVPAAAGPSAPTPAAPAPRANPDEVTRTLASLADLRDRGAITAVEFDEKKADLLARL